jgi:hypothetical protein
MIYVWSDPFFKRTDSDPDLQILNASLSEYRFSTHQDTDPDKLV